MHDVFSDWHRRAILYCVQTSEEPVPVSTLARRLAAWQRNRDGDLECDGAGEPPALHSHVRALEQFGILRRDPESDAVALSEEVTVAVSPPWTGTD